MTSKNPTRNAAVLMMLVQAEEYGVSSLSEVELRLIEASSGALFDLLRQLPGMLAKCLEEAEYVFHVVDLEKLTSRQLIKVLDGTSGIDDPREFPRWGIRDVNEIVRILDQRDVPIPMRHAKPRTLIDGTVI